MKTCTHCGDTHTDNHYMWYNFEELFEYHRVHESGDLCSTCGTIITKKAKEVGLVGEGLIKFNKFVREGVLPMRKYTQQMNGGYY